MLHLDDNLDEMYIEVITRHEGYWEELFKRYHNYSLIENITDILGDNKEGQINLYKHILTRWIRQCKWDIKIPNKSHTDWWILSKYECDSDDEEDGKYSVCPQGKASIILMGWIEFLYLPPTLSDGTNINIENIKSFENLIDLMSKFNPYWLLEICAFTFSYTNFAHCEPNEHYIYNIDKKQFDSIIKNLAQFRDNLKYQKELADIKIQQDSTIDTPLLNGLHDLNLNSPSLISLH